MRVTSATIKNEDGEHTKGGENKELGGSPGPGAKKDYLAWHLDMFSRLIVHYKLLHIYLYILHKK